MDYMDCMDDMDCMDCMDCMDFMYDMYFIDYMAYIDDMDFMDYMDSTDDLYTVDYMDYMLFISTPVARNRQIRSDYVTPASVRKRGHQEAHSPPPRAQPPTRPPAGSILSDCFFAQGMTTKT